MKKQTYSFLEISINAHPIGFSSVVYHYDGKGMASTLSAELLLFNAFYQVDGIQVARQCSVYEEQVLTGALRQDETLTKSVLYKAIANYAALDIQLNRRRESFELEILFHGHSTRCLLVHEFFQQPPFKQLQFLPQGKIMRYPISMEDAAIVSEARAYLESNAA